METDHDSATPADWLEGTCVEASGGMRPDKYLTMVFPHLNRSQIQKALVAGDILLNGSAISKKQAFQVGDVVKLRVEPERELIPQAVNIPLDVLYEDEAIIVVNKPAGMVTHPGNGTGDDTLVHALLFHCNDQLSRLNGEDRPGIVHRLDKDTSGVLVAAKTDEALLKLIDAFKQRTLDKQYLALCCGTPAIKAGTIDQPIARHPQQRLRMAVIEDGRSAQTDWELLRSDRGISLFQCQIHTGRTHQIRVHLSHMGYPIVGDALYGYRKNLHPKVTNLSATRPLLHAYKLDFEHPISGEMMRFEVDPPEDFNPWMKLFSAADS